MRSRGCAVLLLAIWLVSTTSAQSVSTTSGVTPETAYVSGLRYMNAFFGFSLRLPEGVPFRELPSLSGKPDIHWLLGAQFQAKGITVFTVMAQEAKNKSEEDAHKAAADINPKNISRVEIGKKQFWKSEKQEKGPEGKMKSVMFATYMDGYVVKFHIVSYDPKLADELQHAVESVTFFDPADAKNVAGPDSHLYRSPAK